MSNGKEEYLKSTEEKAKTIKDKNLREKVLSDIEKKKGNDVVK